MSSAARVVLLLLDHVAGHPEDRNIIDKLLRAIDARTLRQVHRALVEGPDTSQQRWRALELEKFLVTAGFGRSLQSEPLATRPGSPPTRQRGQGLGLEASTTPSEDEA